MSDLNNIPQAAAAKAYFDSAKGIAENFVPYSNTEHWTKVIMEEYNIDEEDAEVLADEINELENKPESFEDKIVNFLKGSDGATRKEINQMLFGRVKTMSKFEGIKVRNALSSLVRDKKILIDTSSKEYVYSLHQNESIVLDLIAELTDRQEGRAVKETMIINHYNSSNDYAREQIDKIFTVLTGHSLQTLITHSELIVEELYK